MTRRAPVHHDEGVALLFETFSEEASPGSAFQRPSKAPLVGRLLFALAGLVLIAVASLAAGIWMSRRLTARRQQESAVRRATALVTAFTQSCAAYSAAPDQVAVPDARAPLARLDSLRGRYPDSDTLLALRHWTAVQSHVHRGLVALDRGHFDEVEYRREAELVAAAAAGPTYLRVLETLVLLAGLESFQASHPDPVQLAAVKPGEVEVRVARSRGDQLSAALRRDGEWMSIQVPRLHARATRAVGEIVPAVEMWMAHQQGRLTP